MSNFAKLAVGSMCLIVMPACTREDGLGRQAVNGSVTHRGETVGDGQITFRPVRGMNGPIAGTGIKNGEFSIPSDKGPILGAYTVEIKIVDPGNNAANSKLSHAKTHRPLQLMSFSREIEIRSDGNQFDFSVPFTATSRAPKRGR
jgi:hypothetical protein